MTWCAWDINCRTQAKSMAPTVARTGHQQLQHSANVACSTHKVADVSQQTPTRSTGFQRPPTIASCHGNCKCNSVVADTMPLMPHLQCMAAHNRSRLSTACRAQQATKTQRTPLIDAWKCQCDACVQHQHTCWYHAITATSPMSNTPTTQHVRYHSCSCCTTWLRAAATLPAAL